MLMNIQKYLLFFVGFLICSIGCRFDANNPLLPNETSPVEVIGETMNSMQIETSFEQNLLPILTARCAYAGCHVAGGPDGIDLSTYETFVWGGEDEAIFIPGNARSSDIIEEIVSGRMPPDGPPLPAAQIQLFRDWINQQDPADFPNLRYDDYDDHDDDDDDHDDDDDDDHDDDDDDHDDDDDDDDDDKEDRDDD